MENMDLTEKLPARHTAFRLLHRQTLDHREAFWRQQALRLTWQTPFETVVRENFSEARVAWFGDGRLNAAQNVLHRIIDSGKGERTALVSYRGGKCHERLSFNALKAKVMVLAEAFVQKGLKEGDAIALILPASPELTICALAAAYLGITYIPVGTHLSRSLAAECIQTCGARLVILDCRAVEGEKIAQALESPDIITAGGPIEGYPALEDILERSPEKEPRPAFSPAGHPLFAVYETGLGGDPSGLAFPSGGFLVQAHTSFDAIFNKTPGLSGPDHILNLVAASTPAGHAYGLWGPLANGCAVIFTDNGCNASTLTTILEDIGSPAMFCNPSALSEIRDQLWEGSLGTPNRFSVIACCGDTLLPRLVNFASGTLVRMPEHVVNMLVQGQSGTALIHSYPAPELNRPGALGFGALGMDPMVMSDFGTLCKTNVSGNLVFKRSWPSMAQAAPGSEEIYKKSCFSRFRGYFHTNDGMRFDKDGFFWFMGRLDDVIKVRGQSIGTSLIESIIISHPLIDETAIISAGSEEGLVAFVVPREPIGDENELAAEINRYISEKAGRFAVPDKIIFAGSLPRSNTGKLARRLLRRIASGDAGADEDIGHLANTEAVRKLIAKGRESR